MWARASSLVPGRNGLSSIPPPVHLKTWGDVEEKLSANSPALFLQKTERRGRAPSRVFTNLCSPLRMDTSPRKPARAWTLAPTFGWMGNRSRFNYGSYRRTHPSHQLRGRHQHYPPPHQRLHSADGCRRTQAPRRKYPFRQHQPQFCLGPTGKGAVVAEVQTIAVIGAGRVGRGIAQVAARGGYRTILEDL